MRIYVFSLLERISSKKFNFEVVSLINSQIHRYTHTHTPTQACGHTYTHKHTHMHRQTNTYTNTRIHTHIHTNKQVYTNNHKLTRIAYSTCPRVLKTTIIVELFFLGVKFGKKHIFQAVPTQIFIPGFLVYDDVF